MTWTDDECRALLDLLHNGSTRRTVRVLRALDLALDTGWASVPSRRSHLVLTARGELAIPSFLDQHMPDWRALRDRLGEGPVTRSGLRALRRSGHDLPAGVLNVHTFAAIVARDAKAEVNEAEAVSRGCRVTRDDALRVRADATLVLRTTEHEIDLLDIAQKLGEAALPERLLLDGSLEVARCQASRVLTVENLGAWIDLTPPPDTICLHLPGWNLRTACRLLRLLGHLPLVHFGDVDEDGLAIPEAMSHALGRDVEVYLPTWWAERVHGWAIRAERKWTPPAWSPPWVSEVAEAGLRLEQEVIAVDPRVAHDLGHAVRQGTGRVGHGAT